MKDKYDVLKLENQLCFPLYACAKEVVKRYTPLIRELDLTYTQYIVMMVMWEHKEMNVKALGAYLFLDSGTLTPLLKKLEQKGLVTRKRSRDDERILNIAITPAGEKLRERAVEIPRQVGQCIPIEPEDAQQLYQLLHKMLKAFEKE